jgi:hypothetical protein
MPEKRRWTDDDIALLINMAGKQPSAKIAGMLGRGMSAVAVKAHELRLSLKMDRARQSQVTRPDPGPSGMDLTDWRTN